MAMASAQPPSNNFRASVQVDETHVRGNLQFLSISLLQCGARQHSVKFSGIPFDEQISQLLEPGAAIEVSERDRTANLFNVRGGMVIIGVGKEPTLLLGEQAPHSGFARADNAHHDDYHFLGLPDFVCSIMRGDKACSLKSERDRFIDEPTRRSIEQ